MGNQDPALTVDPSSFICVIHLRGLVEVIIV